MRILITGASGFAGQHLVRHLKHAQPDAELHGTQFGFTPTALEDGIRYHALDLRQQATVYALLGELRPDVIYHLAGQASPAQAFVDPWETLEINIHAQFNILEGCRIAQIAPRTLVVTSAEVYGTVEPHEIPITEVAPLRPATPYSLSKITQDMMAWHYYLGHHLPVIRARAFNHAGRGQREAFVIPAFAMQIARAEVGLQDPIIRVGNLSAARDFTDVRDTVRAYHALIEQGTAGEAYNIASGQAYPIQQILDLLCSYATIPITVAQDPARLRPTDTPIIRGDYSKLHTATGWQPHIPLEQTLREVLDDCRQRTQSSLRS